MGYSKWLATERMLKGNRGGGSGLGVGFRMQEAFFDRPAVIRAVERAGKRYLSHAGGYVRKSARTSIKRKGLARAKPKRVGGKAEQRWLQEVKSQPASPPGTPPYTHTGFLRDDILYSYDAVHQSAVIGPWRKPWLNQLHEYGGLTPMIVVRGPRGTTWLQRAKSRVRRSNRVIKTMMVRYPARPFMGPALERSLPKLPQMWANSVRAV